MNEAFGRATLSKGEHSRMAELVAIGRAAHQFMDRDVIFPDPLARRIIGAAAERWLQDNLEWQHIEGLRRTRVLLAIRSRFTEEELQRAAAEGTTQYVILGAGLDTFAYRRLEFGRRLTIYEVDQPATQRWKMERLTEADIAIPPNVRFVPVDFAQCTLAEALARSGFDRRAPAFFSWLGVTYYLTREAVLETLGFIGGQQAASEVIFDFALAREALPAETRNLMDQILSYIATTGEPWQTLFIPQELIGSLREMAFQQVTRFHAEDLARRYIGRADGLGPIVALIAARHATSR
jgi:methyltransferase (TIGR00027 family)